MTSSAPLTLDRNTDILALLVIGSIRSLDASPQCLPFHRIRVYSPESRYRFLRYGGLSGMGSLEERWHCRFGLLSAKANNSNGLIPKTQICAGAANSLQVLN